MATIQFVMTIIIGCRAELEGLLTLCEKYANKAREIAEISSGKEKKEYTELYNVLVQVPAKPARTFREAIQSIHMFTWSMYGIFSYGKPDVYLLPYYMNDIRKQSINSFRSTGVNRLFFSSKRSQR